MTLHLLCCRPDNQPFTRQNTESRQQCVSSVRFNSETQHYRDNIQKTRVFVLEILKAKHIHTYMNGGRVDRDLN